jgi:hypothetical protein
MTVITSATGTSSPTITIDGKAATVAASGKTEITLSKGSHTITKGTSNTFIYYISVKVLGSDGLVTKVYKSVADIDETLYSDTNIQHIKNCLSYAPYEVVVISGSSVKFADFAPYIRSARSTGWIAFADEESPTQDDLASWIKSMEKQGYTYKAVGTTKGMDCKQYVYFNQTVYDSDGEELSAPEYLPNLLGILASCNITRGCTNYLCTDLSEVTEVDDVDTAVSSGQLVLTNEVDGVRIVSGINSLVTLNGNTATEDMQYIETVEAMNLIRDDIRTEFKSTYQGSFKNKHKYQMLFIGAVNEYLRSLAGEDVLDDEYDNFAEIDVDAQRSAWLGTGKSEAEDWSEDKVRSMSFKRSVFIACDIKILNCMENLKFTVTME